MKKLMSKAAILLIASPMLMLGSGNTVAEVSKGDSGAITFSGDGCSAGPTGTEYASSVFTFSDNDVNHGVLHKGDNITQTITISLQEVVSNLPETCDAIEVNLSVSQGVANVGENLTVGTVGITGSGNTTIGALGTHTVTLPLTVNNASPNDLAEAIKYDIPVTISLTVLANGKAVSQPTRTRPSWKNSSNWWIWFR